MQMTGDFGGEALQCAFRLVQVILGLPRLSVSDQDRDLPTNLRHASLRGCAVLPSCRIIDLMNVRTNYRTTWIVWQCNDVICKSGERWSFRIHFSCNAKRRKA